MLSRGVVIDVQDAELIILQYDFEEEEDVENVYQCEEGVELVNIESLADLEAGDFVEVVYEEEDEAKKATRVILQ